MPFAFTIRREVRYRILEAALGSARVNEYSWANSDLFLDQIFKTRARAWLPKEFDSFDSLVLASYKDAREDIKKRLGDDESQWTWGRFAQVRFPHPVARIPIAGSRFVIDPSPQNGVPGAVNVGASVSMRLITEGLLSVFLETHQVLTGRTNLIPGETYHRRCFHSLRRKFRVPQKKR
jgi:acyl-homoserine lactone acylase PvdQ